MTNEPGADASPHRSHVARPRWWPHFSSPLRSTALTARLGAALGIAFGICFVTGLLSHYQYHPWSWLPEPASPVWAYRVTQGLHVATGIAIDSAATGEVVVGIPEPVSLAADPVAAQRTGTRVDRHPGIHGAGAGVHRLLQRA